MTSGSGGTTIRLTVLVLIAFMAAGLPTTVLSPAMRTWQRIAPAAALSKSSAVFVQVAPSTNRPSQQLRALTTTTTTRFPLTAETDTATAAAPTSTPLIVVKIGGNAMSDDVVEEFARDIAELQRSCAVDLVVVHGGGPQIDAELARRGIQARFVDGRRVTDRDTIGAVQDVLVDVVNRSVVDGIRAAGGLAVGLTGVIDARLASPDLGFVGIPVAVKIDAVVGVLSRKAVPILTPLGVDEEGNVLNVNADTVAAAVADALGADRLVVMTNVAGVLDRDRRLLSQLTASDARRLIDDGTISGGMIPKIESALECVEGSRVGGVVILDGRPPRALVDYLLGGKDGGGTAATVVLPDRFAPVT